MQSQPLTKADIELMLKQEGVTRQTILQIVQENIKQFKLPFKIEDGKLIEVGDTTEAYLSRFVTMDIKMLQLKEDVLKLAPLEEDVDQLFTVLICGPTGTGKEIIAHALHGDRIGEFVPINCAGLPQELIESELFGHTQGAFTGATKEKEGLMQTAKRGTLFLDEVGELPLAAQAKLLRAIQVKKVRKVGGIKDESISCRIVCATHQNLREMCDRNQFRVDLYSRISTFELHTTSLAERPGDITPIIKSLKGGEEFLTAIAGQLHSIDLSMNVRSLQQHVKRFKILGKLP